MKYVMVILKKKIVFVIVFIFLYIVVYKCNTLKINYSLYYNSLLMDLYKVYINSKI